MIYSEIITMESFSVHCANWRVSILCCYFTSNENLAGASVPKSFPGFPIICKVTSYFPLGSGKSVSLEYCFESAFFISLTLAEGTSKVNFCKAEIRSNDSIGTYISPGNHGQLLRVISEISFPLYLTDVFISKTTNPLLPMLSAL